MMETLSCLTVLALFTGFCTCQNVLEPSTANGAVGESVWFKTNLNPPAKPFIALLWSLNLENIITFYREGNSTINYTTPAYHDRLLLDTSTGSLELKDLTLNDSGVYSLVIVPNGSEGRHGEIKLQVYEKISNPSIKPSQAIVIANKSSVNLTCESLGDIIDIEWTKDGKPLCLSNTITFHGKNRTLMISPVQKTDMGEYKCRLSNPVSAMTANYTMTVSYGPLDVTVRGNGKINSPNNTTFTCSADSYPPANFSWMFNGKQTDVTDPVYKVMNSAAGDTGNYTCIANNGITGITVSVTHSLIVNYGPLNVNLHGPGTINSPDNTTLNCSADSYPPAKFSWAFNDKEIDVTGPVYKIFNSKAKDSGNYTCIASNNITGSKVHVTHTLLVNGGSSFAIQGILSGVTLWMFTTLYLIF